MTPSPSRRSILRSLVGGSLMMPAILSEVARADAGLPSAAAADPLMPRPTHFAPKAKRVIFLFMTGGVSHVDSFDHKPRLIADAGKSVPTKSGRGGSFLKAPSFDFKRRGQSGRMVSDLFPHVGAVADDLCVVNSMYGDHGNHFEATLGIHTGSVSFTRPSIGSWISYGLGTLNQNLPSFVVLAPQLPYAGGQVWGCDFLPACHQGTRVIPGPEPIPAMHRRAATQDLQDLELGLLGQLNRKHLTTRGGADPELAARIRSFETAAGMQAQAPEAFDLSGETDATLALYGMQRGQTKGFGWQCLVARRLAERGVRFIELIDVGASSNWDSHGDMKAHVPLARNVDQPIAGLLRDLKSRGMLDDTLVVWTTEFGRTPMIATKDGKGREHHAQCFTSWIAGGGAKPGTAYGSSDDYGILPATDPVHVHDFHATILALLGLDHERLTFRHAGRDFRLTDVAGKVVKGMMA
ncbi:MAG TPA: DUF1501 domain-containing protein [Tepidisphaeraceae bacterium]|nr:DUF1501 domain-containing protein [Tepidisphaeraceae bacterium]